MNRFLLGALAMGAVFALTSFALHNGSETLVKRTGVWKISDLQLDRTFRQPFNFPGGPAGSQQTILVQIPASGGLVITQILAGTVLVNHNGLTEQVTMVQSGAYVPLDPPIVARPGDTLALTGVAGAPGTIAGYTTYPGET